LLMISSRVSASRLSAAPKKWAILAPTDRRQVSYAMVKNGADYSAGAGARGGETSVDMLWCLDERAR
jgi:hypothetical protein